MTVKEKAKELIKDFTYCEDGEMYIDTAKKCALIAINEIIKVCPYYDSEIREDEAQLSAFEFQFVSYWEKVKVEIN